MTAKKGKTGLVCVSVSGGSFTWTDGEDTTKKSQPSKVNCRVDVGGALG